MRYVVAVDGTAPGEVALDHAIDLVTDLGASLVAVHAVDPGVYEERRTEPATETATATATPNVDIGAGGYADPVADDAGAASLAIKGVEDAERRGETILDDAADRGQEHGVEIDTELLYGEPVVTITEFAEANGVAGIIAGHRDVAKDHNRVIGSTAKGLVDRTEIPVTIVG